MLARMLWIRDLKEEMNKTIGNKGYDGVHEDRKERDLMRLAEFGEVALVK